MICIYRLLTLLPRLASDRVTQPWILIDATAAGADGALAGTRGRRGTSVFERQIKQRLCHFYVKPG